MQEFKVKIGETEVQLATKKPNRRDIDQADKAYSAKVAEIIRNNGANALMRAEIEAFLQKTGIWSEEDESKLLVLNKEIEIGLDKILKKGGITKKEGRAIAINVWNRRMDVLRLMQKRRVFDESTVESQAEEARRNCLMWLCTIHKDSGRTYWSDVEEMLDDQASEVFEKAYVSYYEYVEGINSEFERQMPENRWLAKYGFVDHNLNFVDPKTGKHVDINGKELPDNPETHEEAVIRELNKIVAPIGDTEQPFTDDE